MTEEEFWALPLHRQVRLAAIFGLGVGGIFLAGNWYAVSPIGWGGFPLTIGLTPVLIPLVFAPIVIALAPIWLLFSTTRRRAFCTMLSCAVFIALSYPLVILAPEIQMSAFERLALRSTSLISAIDDFAQEHGRPPHTLNELVPKFLPEIPSTGMPGYPKYEFSSDHDSDR